MISGSVVARSIIAEGGVGRSIIVGGWGMGVMFTYTCYNLQKTIDFKGILFDRT